jgi:predicted permease
MSFRERMSEFWLRLRALVRRRRLDRDLEDELRFHASMREDQLRESGLSALDAGKSARRSFGNPTRFKETCRDLWTFSWLESLWQDLSYGVRVLRKSPLFTAMAVLSLALGIGASTSIFTLINAVLLEKLPVRDPDQLVIAGWSSSDGLKDIMMTNARTAPDPATGRTSTNVFHYGAFERFRGRAGQLSDVFGFTSISQAALSIRGRTDLVNGMCVSGGYYKGLGIRPLIGQLLDENDDRPSSDAAVVISYQLWRDTFNADPRAIGSGVTLNGVPMKIIGVTRPGFYGVSHGGFMPSPDITISLALVPRVKRQLSSISLPMFSDSGLWWVQVMGRLRPGVTRGAAETELNGIFHQALQEANIQPGPSGKLPALYLSPGAQGIDSLRSDFSRPLWILMAAAGLVLLIACANVAALMLERATVRQQEIAARLALGAGRWRLVRQLLTESLLLSLGAGAIGALLAYGGSHALLRWATTTSSGIRVPLGPDLRVLAFAVGLSVLTGVLFGLAPAFRASRVDLVSALKQRTGAAAGAGRRNRSGRLGQGLITVQVALSLVLVVTAGLFVRTLRNLQSVNLGFRSEGILLFGLDPTLNGYEGERLFSFYRELLSRLDRTPRVVSATASSHRLVTGWRSNGPAYIPGATWLRNSRIQVDVNNVGPQFFDTMGIPVLLGRGPGQRDTAGAPHVAFVNQKMAEQAFPDGSPLGKTISLFKKSGAEYQVAGVVGNAHYAQLKGDVPATVYIPYEQSSFAIRSLNFAVRTAGKPEPLAGTVRSIVRELDPNLPLIEVRTQQGLIDDQLKRERMFASLSTAAGLIALLLACVGVYGVWHTAWRAGRARSAYV